MPKPLTLPYPTLLHAKELYYLHFDPLACALAPASLLQKEITPLLDFAIQSKWIEVEDKTLFLKNLNGSKQTHTLWEEKGAAFWISRINPHSSNTANAIAAWHVLSTLHKAQLAWLGYLPPYPALTLASSQALFSRLEHAIQLSLAFESSTTLMHREGPRHFLALLLLKQNQSDQIKSFNRQILKEKALVASQLSPVLHATLGLPETLFPFRAPFIAIDYLTTHLIPTFSKEESAHFSWWKEQLYKP